MRALLLLCVASSAYAGNNELSLGGTTRALRASSADAVTSDSLDGGQLTYARALDVPVPGGLALWADAGLEWGSARGTMFRTMATEIYSFAPMVGARLIYLPHPRLALAARVAVGSAHESLSLTGANGATVKDQAWGGIALASLAIDVRAIKTPRLDLALRFQLGYLEASRVGLSPHGEGPSEGTLTLPVMDESIGHLDLSGPTAEIGVVAGF